MSAPITIDLATAPLASPRLTAIRTVAVDMLGPENCSALRVRDYGLISTEVARLWEFRRRIGVIKRLPPGFDEVLSALRENEVRVGLVSCQTDSVIVAVWIDASGTVFGIMPFTKIVPKAASTSPPRQP
jgi:hypothetical protein